MTSGPEPRAATGRAFGLRGIHALLIASAVTIVTLAVVVAVLASRPGGSPQTRAATAPTPSASPSAGASPSVADVYRRVVPSVVVVRTEHGSLGSGVIVANAGTVLTAGHVVADGGAITLTFSDGTRSTATVASTDPETDTAMLTPATLPQPVVPATLGSRVEVGGEVIALGNPLGLTYSVSSGVVSGLDRTAATESGELSGLIQFDAAVNAGSSGGPLLDADGLVVGIVVSIADPGEDDAFAGIGFAVPISSALGSGGGGSGPGGGRGPRI
ncbi:S1C family serine protease [Parafrankia sp. EUN1f]|uniref:S1C family serine protease n=1 Tax=Parafrankia sp. EUN1f TaxID=102897 RepID=UPI0001C45EE5|nr:trypsin-like peptidase domain-containing protein [Parafrankia sp. EUN1f]EFC81839.1 peptidase S1 and S6 chymotrypsin/Hap [Parafrankia sp. EUN1f]